MAKLKMVDDSDGVLVCNTTVTCVDLTALTFGNAPSKARKSYFPRRGAGRIGFTSIGSEIAMFPYPQLTSIALLSDI